MPQHYTPTRVFSFFPPATPLLFTSPCSGPLVSLRSRILMASDPHHWLAQVHALGPRSSSAIFSAYLRRSCALPIALLRYVHVHAFGILLPAQLVRVRPCALYLHPYFMVLYTLLQYVSASWAHIRAHPCMCSTYFPSSLCMRTCACLPITCSAGPCKVACSVSCFHGAVFDLLR